MRAIEPSKAIQRLHKQIAAAGVPQVVVRDFKDRFVIFHSLSPRLAAMERSPVWAQRILGIFAPSVDMATLVEELS